MKQSWDSIEMFVRRVVSDFSDANGETLGRFEGLHHFLLLFPLLRKSEALAQVDKLFDKMTIIFENPKNYDRYVTVVPPSPMLNGTVDTFWITLHEKGENDEYVHKLTQEISYKEMNKIIQCIEDCCAQL